MNNMPYFIFRLKITISREIQVLQLDSIHFYAQYYILF